MIKMKAWKENFMKTVKGGIAALAGTLTGTATLAQNVLAAEAVTNGINNLSSFVVGIIAAAGAVVLAQGIWDFASAYRSHDSGTQSQAIRGIIAGLIMMSASAVISVIRG